MRRSAPASASAPGRRFRRIAGSVFASSLVLASCSGSGSDSAAGPSTSTAAAGVEVPEVSLAAPEDCLTNPFCAPGLRDHYGVDVREALGPRKPREVVARIVDRSALVGVAFSADPTLAAAVDDGDVVVLEDDQAMVGAERVVPVASTRTLDELPDSFSATVDRVSAALTTKDLQSLIAGADGDGADPAALDTWVSEHGPFSEGSGKVVVGAQDFRENLILAQVYVAALDAAGFQAEVEQVQGYRGYLWDAVVFGDVALGIEYTSSAAEFLSGYQGVSSADVDQTVEVLREAAYLRDVTVLDPSPAESHNEFVMRADVAERLGITKISDLAKVFPKVAADRTDDEVVLTLGSGPDDPGVGDVGPRIVQLQERLIELSYDPGPANGTFGPETREAVADFQACQGLGTDGVVGPATQAALDDPKPCVETGTSTDAGGGGGGGTGPLVPEVDGQVVYLTFDDGPHPTYTPQVLDLLARFEAKATFFNVGQQVSANPALVKRMVAEGHVVENHTWSHVDLRKVGKDQFASEVDATSKAIVDAGAPEVGCLRPPYGAKNQNVQTWADAEGLKLVLWDVDPQDWSRPGVDAIVSNVLGATKPGSIVLMHDGGGNRTQTVAALEQILTSLSSSGYSFSALPC